MIIIGETIVSEDIFDTHFVCDLNACKGACCVEGNSGAPLKEEEVEELKKAWPAVKPLLTEEYQQVVEKVGFAVTDEDGDLTTPLVVENGPCAFLFHDENGWAKCAYETAFLAGKTTWKKPISCHLYPIRLTKLKDYIGVNYHRWGICAPACDCGSKLQVPLYRFLQEPLVRAFGQAWMDEANLVYDALRQEREMNG
jgi:hypothetical protein